MTTLKEWMDAKWREPGVIDGACGVIFLGTDYKTLQLKSGAERKIALDKETKRRQAGLQTYNKKLAPVILAEATLTDGVYRWPAHEKAEPVESVPRKRVSRVKLAQAQEILSKVPQDELAGFLARFGLSMSLAASIASLDNIEMIARQFLRATL